VSRIGRALQILAAAACVAVFPQPAAAAGVDGVACEITYEPHAYWGGFTADITVRNTGTATIYGWTLSFPMDEGVTIRTMWNAELASPAGMIVATNAAYNGTVTPGRSVGVGFDAGGAATGVPSTFTVNGVTCAIA
jgi:Cellulose binding domain